ncbi:HNH endonuclease signature motif containing protein [Rhodococcoides trifolii]|nr:HNH endonuclease signature motif containing protein [Rhodococcus trifolii]
MITDYAQHLTTIEEHLCVLAASNTALGENEQRAELIRRLDTLANRALALQYPLIQQLTEQPGYVSSGLTKTNDIIVDLTRCTPREANQRRNRARDVTVTTTPAGVPVEPQHPRLCAAVADGAANRQHLKVIDDFRRYLARADTDSVDPNDLAHAVDALGYLTRHLTADELALAAREYSERLLPDGIPDNDTKDVAFLTISPQREDGLRRIVGLIEAELHAYLEPYMAKYSAPGMLNPDDATPITDPEPDSGADADAESDDDRRAGAADDDDESGDDARAGTDEHGDGVPGDREPPAPESAEQQARRDTAAARDTRTAGKRRHDALKFVLRTALMSGKFGTHRGIPVSVVITTTLADLDKACGYVRTGGGTRLTRDDLRRMATHSDNYLVVFDEHTRKPLYFGRTRRTASPEQRYVLHGLDRGCTFPGCTGTAYYSEAHHRIDDWADGGNSDGDAFAFACPKHHRLHGTEPHQFRTSVAPPEHPYPGRTLWHHNTADPTMSHGRINHAHHPEEYLITT